MIRARHVLVWPDETGREFAISTASSLRPNASVQQVEALIRSGVPAIVRRQESPRQDILEVGFSSHEYVDGSRLRVSAEIPAESVAKAVTPFDVMCSYDYKAHPRGALLEELFSLTGRYGLRMGLYGSTALHIVTGLPYSRADSDLDLFLSPAEKTVREFYETVRTIGERAGVRLDIEADLGDGYACKLAEYFSGQKTVLAKGYDDVKLLRIEEINTQEGTHVQNN